MPHPTPVLVQTPAHSQVAGPLTYTSEQPLPPGTLVRVPLGHRELLGVVWDGAPEAALARRCALLLDQADLRVRQLRMELGTLEAGEEG